MNRKVYLMDYENVREEGFNIVASSGDDDLVITFYSKNADKVSISVIEKLVNTCRVNFVKVEPGKDSLDHCLGTYLGYLIKTAELEGEEPEYIILSNDKGFSAIVTFWKGRGKNIKLQPTVSENQEPSKPKTNSRFKKRTGWRNSEPTAQTAPSAEEKPAEPATEPTPVVEEKPAEPVAEPVPVVEEKPVEPATEPAPVVEEKPAEPVLEPASTVEDKFPEPAAEAEVKKPKAPAKKGRKPAKKAEQEKKNENPGQVNPEAVKPAEPTEAADTAPEKKPAEKKTKKKPAKPAKEVTEEKPEPEKKPEQAKPVPDRTQLNNKIIQTLVGGGVESKLAGKAASLIFKCLNAGQTKFAIYNEMRKAFGNEQGKKVYKLTSDLIVVK